MKKTVIEFKNFSFQYRAQECPTLNNINLTIYEGEKILIVGPSGCGKSTITNCINGLAPFLYEGEIKGSLKVNGRETRNSDIAGLSNEVGTVLQDPDGQFIGLTVAEDIAFKLENECVPQEEMIRRVDMVSKIVGVDTYLDASPHSLSGGQKQRVTLAGVMVSDAKILLFDEPLASLDPATGKVSIELIDKIHKENNKTIIIIEHRLEDVLHRDVDRIIVMHEGEILADISPDKLLASNVLIENGIREPLYVTALKYADIPVKEEMKLASINTIELDEYKEKLRNWSSDVEEIAIAKESEVILEFKNVDFSYDKKGKQILKDVSFKVEKGEILSIVGRNGAGKSTISKLICGFYKPTKGQVLFEGKDMIKDSIKERAENIGIVMQNPNQMISKPMIMEEVGLGLKVRGFSEEETKERVIETLKICGLYPFRNWPISALSYGQKKRVTIASILVLNPKVIILDEPTAGQDFKHYTEIMEFLVELNKKGVTIIMVTHDIHLMLEYTDRGIVLAGGQKIAEDIASNILTDGDVIERANLKETSLYELAVKLGFEKPRNLVNKFIEVDRRAR
ncbi:ABC transporter ATP-binding protein [uncultured Clostridium sp.]|uniref:ABC transporter ATP-binding protein n=1 Tax=uncultured Clostridium sp. TaxID=59620 RepID=UPI0026061B20|nr:ABC transporter ATP-binding protein [uncultured Clostridium sp.]